MTGQLALLFPALPVQGPAKPRANPGPAGPRLRVVPPATAPGLPRLGDRRAAARLDPDGDRGLQPDSAEVIVRGWGRPVTDVPLTLAGAL